MLPVILLLVTVLLALGAYFIRGRRAAQIEPVAPPRAPAAPSAAPDSDPGHSPQALSARLFGLAFSVSAPRAPYTVQEEALRERLVQELNGGTLREERLPRRPTLMPQLMRAMDDPSVEAERLSRIVAHDPVLAAEVLKVANSGLYRVAGTAPVETIQRALVVLGADALRGILASAMLQPVFRATRRNFPRFPRMLWERTERAVRAAELYALKRDPADRFEAQFAVLLSALGPLVVYGALLDAYEKEAALVPNGALCLELVLSQSKALALAVAHRWQASPRLVAALEGQAGEPLSAVLQAGELLGTLSLLHVQQMMSTEEAAGTAHAAGIPPEVVENLLARIVA